MKNGIVVTVQGFGGTFRSEFQAILKALEALGCTVEVTDECPSNGPAPHKSDAHVKLIADHVPWGG